MVTPKCLKSVAAILKSKMATSYSAQCGLYPHFPGFGIQ